jgi:hypothetical protein
MKKLTLSAVAGAMLLSSAGAFAVPAVGVNTVETDEMLSTSTQPEKQTQETGFWWNSKPQPSVGFWWNSKPTGTQP